MFQPTRLLGFAFELTKNTWKAQKTLVKKREDEVRRLKNRWSCLEGVSDNIDSLLSSFRRVIISIWLFNSGRFHSRLLEASLQWNFKRSSCTICDKNSTIVQRFSQICTLYLVFLLYKLQALKRINLRLNVCFELTKSIFQWRHRSINL